MSRMKLLRTIVLLAAVGASASHARADDIARIGVVKSTFSAPIYVAAAKGYFAREGIDPKITFFEAAQPIFVAVVSGDLDFGISGVTGGFYQLANQGQLRIIAAHAGEVPGFQAIGVFVSTPAYDGGLKSLKDLPGHSVAITTTGSTFHYSLALIAEKYGLDMRSMTLKALQQNSAAASALAGGTVDAAVISNVYGLGPVTKGQAKLLAWVGDETPWQIGVTAISPKTADTRGEYVQRFLRAYREGARYYHDAVTGPDGHEHLNANADEVIAITAQAIGQSVDEVKQAIAYADPDERVSISDIVHQDEWYTAQGMIKGTLNAEQVIDRRYAMLKPE